MHLTSCYFMWLLISIAWNAHKINRNLKINKWIESNRKMWAMWRFFFLLHTWPNSVNIFNMHSVNILYCGEWMPVFILGAGEKMELPTSSNFSAEQNRWFIWLVYRYKLHFLLEDQFNTKISLVPTLNDEIQKGKSHEIAYTYHLHSYTRGFMRWKWA